MLNLPHSTSSHFTFELLLSRIVMAVEKNNACTTQLNREAKIPTLATQPLCHLLTICFHAAVFKCYSGRPECLKSFCRRSCSQWRKDGNLSPEIELCWSSCKWVHLCKKQMVWTIDLISWCWCLPSQQVGSPRVSSCTPELETTVTTRSVWKNDWSVN